MKFDRVIRNDKHIMSFALYELGFIHINREEVRNREMQQQVEFFLFNSLQEPGSC